VCSAFFAQYNIGRFFLPFSPEKKLSGKAILRKGGEPFFTAFIKSATNLSAAAA
jgi:hypothetical protein